VNAEAIRTQFPQLQREIKGHPYSYLDSGATTLKPKAVLDKLNCFYGEDYATIHRGAYQLSEKATQDYEDVRAKVVGLIGASRAEEIIFTGGATESLNLVANTFGETHIFKGDVILVSAMEHHSNIVPWQILAEKKQAKVVKIPMDDRGVLDMEAYGRLLGQLPVKMVCVNHVSNALGTVNPVEGMVSQAKEAGAVTVVDGAQSVSHLPVNVLALGCDFFVFSGHKLYGPTGVGVLFGRYALLEKMPPWQGGGDMIESVSFEKTTFACPPARFEAGTPAIAEVIGMGAAIDWILEIGLEQVCSMEKELLEYALLKLSDIPGLTLIGTAPERAGLLSFVLDVAHAHDIATIVDGEGVAVRAGHHCAQPVMDQMGVPATARASLGVYNTREDIDRLSAALFTVRDIFS
jgi:cysteine desulfurase/selenocysteine lyase